VEQDVSEECGDTGDESGTDVAPGDTESGPLEGGHTWLFAITKQNVSLVRLTARTEIPAPKGGGPPTLS